MDETMTAIRISVNTRESLNRLKLRVGAEIGIAIPMHQIIETLYRLGDANFTELVRLAQNQEPGK